VVLGQYFCEKCGRPIKQPGLCPSCVEKELRTIRMGNYCDFCHKLATETSLYINVKTKKRYCTECMKVFRTQLLLSGLPGDYVDKIMKRDFIPINWNTHLKLHRKKPD